MNTFLPLQSYEDSLWVLDKKRLGKQRVEAWQMITAILDPSYGWQHHPAVNMWRDYPLSLMEYYNYSLLIWKARGGNNKKLQIFEHVRRNVEKPWWFGMPEFHASHRSNLLRKDPVYYGQFGWSEGPELPYVWPAQKSPKEDDYDKGEQRWF